MNITYVKQKKCASFLKNFLAPEANCMDMAKQKIKNKLIATFKGELKKVILKKMKQY